MTTLPAAEHSTSKVGVVSEVRSSSSASPVSEEACKSGAPAGAVGAVVSTVVSNVVSVPSLPAASTGVTVIVAGPPSGKPGAISHDQLPSAATGAVHVSPFGPVTTTVPPGSPPVPVMVGVDVSIASPSPGSVTVGAAVGPSVSISISRAGDSPDSLPARSNSVNVMLCTPSSKPGASTVAVSVPAPAHA